MVGAMRMGVHDVIISITSWIAWIEGWMGAGGGVVRVGVGGGITGGVAVVGEGGRVSGFDGWVGGWW